MARVEELLSEQLSGARGVIDDITGHLSDAGGKRMRPIMTLLCAHLGKPGQPASDNVIAACLVVELTHLATLYHDDVMDSAPTRRGVEAVHKVYGNNRAILAGDVIFARASLLCSDLGSEATGQHARTFYRLCKGQLNETFGAEENDDPVDYYIEVLADKTGSLIAQAARFGAEYSGAPEYIADRVSEFGEDIGVAFQIADDVLDIASDPDISGKTPGTDLKEGVDTLPILLLRQAKSQGSIDEDGQKILDLIDADLSKALATQNDVSIDSEASNAVDTGHSVVIDNTVAQIVKMLRVHPVLEDTRNLARKWADKAKASLDDIPDSRAKTALYEFADMLVERMA
ncbi:MAG: polyprenyl synthetase family protein [Actinomycetaceae bacterium]|nr:polyprenyl synthetase family protein [Actinomycetaceae bacterium]